jgi:hypothetical protein
MGRSMFTEPMTIEPAFASLAWIDSPTACLMWLSQIRCLQPFHLLQFNKETFL